MRGFARLWKICLSLIASVCLGMGPETHDDDPAKILEDTILGEAESLRSRVDRLFALPGWNERMASQLADLVRKSRINAKDLASYYHILTHSRNPYEKSAQLTADDEAALRVQRASEPRVNLGSLLRLLASSQDRRVVPLIAPLLAENTETIKGDDYSINSPQLDAVDDLNRLVRANVIEGIEAYGAQNVEIWRRWWATNRSEYSPVCEGLLAIDGGGEQLSAAVTGNGTTPAPASVRYIKNLKKDADASGQTVLILTLGGVGLLILSSLLLFRKAKGRG